MPNHIQQIHHISNCAPAEVVCHDRLFFFETIHTYSSNVQALHYKIYRSDDNSILYSLQMYCGAPYFGSMRYERFWVEIKTLGMRDFKDYMKLAYMYYANRNYVVTQRVFNPHYYIFMRDQNRWRQVETDNVWVYPITEYARDKVRKKSVPWS